MSARNTVYILGAGFSADAGLPLLSNLLRELLALDCNSVMPLRQAKRRSEGKLAQLRGWFKLPPEEYQNLEAVFSVFEYYELEDEMHGHFFKDVKRLLHVLLRRKANLGFRLSPGDIPFGMFAGNEPRTAYHQFVQERLIPRRSDQTVTVITLNYDLILESAIWRLGERVDYRTHGAPGWENVAESGVPILKLHGSINWVAGSTSNAIVVGGPECAPCRDNDVGDDSWVMLPPTTQKNVFTIEPLKSIWLEALASLGELDQLVIIGYSLPPTDPYFRHFLTAGLNRNQNLFDVVTFLHEDDEARARFDRFFTGGGVTRDRIAHHEVGFHDGLLSGLL